MMKEIVRGLETGALAEVGVVAFFVAFALILARTLLMSKQERDDARQMPLDDQETHPSVTHFEPTA